MKVYTKKTAGAFALLASAALVLSGCSSTSSEPNTDTGSSEQGGADQLKIATMLPLTGGLGFLRPPVEAGISLALEEIEAAGGVLGQPVEIVAETDEGDDKDRTVIESSRDQVVSSDAAFVLGAMGTASTLHVYEDITNAGILMGSPSNTGVQLSGVSDFFFRTAPSDAVQGSTLAQLILSDGKASVGFLTFNNPYGTGLRDRIEDLVTEGGAEVVYGGKSSGDEFAADQTTFSAEVTALKDSGAEAVVIVTYDQVEQIIPELQSQGVDLSSVYLVDGSLKNFTGLDAGALDGMQGTKPGYEVDAEFLEQLKEAYSEGSLDDLTYAAEAYDLVNLVALATEKAGSADSAAIQAELAAVSGANGGTECSTFAECRDLIADGEDIQYVTRAGVGPLNSDNDPSTAWIGIYQYGADDNEPHFVRSEEGAL